MLTVNSSPEQYNFSRNRMFVEIETDNYSYNVNYGDKAICYFGSLQNAVINNTLTVHWGSGVRVYTFKAATNIGALEIAVIGVGQDPFAYTAQLANDISGDAVLAAVLDVSAYETSLFFASKLPGAVYTFNASSHTVAGAHFYTTPGTDDIQTVVRPNYRIQMELFGWDGSAWEPIVTISKEPTNNKMRCDISHFVDNHLDYDLPPFGTAFAINQPFKCTKSCTKFRVKVCEVFGTPAIPQPTSLTGMTYTTFDGNKFVSAEFYYLKAGFDTLGAQLRPTGQFIYYGGAVGYNFLTRQPRTKKIGRAQREWLYFLFQTAVPNQVVIQYKLYDALGNETITYALNTTPFVGIAQYDMWAFPINRPNGYFATNSNYVKMKVCVYDQTAGQALSETFTYLVDEDYPLEETVIYFTNSDSGLDTNRCVGVHERIANFEDLTTERTLDISDTKFDGDEKLVYIKRNNSYVVYSGFKTATELNYIEELFMSQLIFFFKKIYDQELEIVIPLLLTSKQLEPHRTNRNLHRYVIELREAVKTELSQVRHHPILP